MIRLGKYEILLLVQQLIPLCCLNVSIFLTSKIDCLVQVVSSQELREHVFSRPSWPEFEFGWPRWTRKVAEAVVEIEMGQLAGGHVAQSVVGSEPIPRLKPTTAPRVVASI